MSKLKTLETILGKGRVEENKQLFPYLTLKTKTQAKFFFAAKSRDDLILARKASSILKLPLLILGGGSNLAITKKNLDYLVVKNSYLDFKLLQNKKDYVLVSVSSGYPVPRLVRETVEKGWAGLHYHQGLPGTVGGAIYNNSKWTRPLSYFSDNLVEAYVVDNRLQAKKVKKAYFQFGYDYSILQKTKEILLETIFKLKKIDPKLLKKQSDKALTYRRQTQPQGVFTSGCFFKNPRSTSAGYLIDKAGLKGIKIGQFYISEKHANFIVNQGNGKPEDLKKLLKLIKNKVKKKFGVELEEEVIII